MTPVGEERAVFLLSFTHNFVVSVLCSGCLRKAVLWWHSMGLPYDYSIHFHLQDS